MPCPNCGLSGTHHDWCPRKGEAFRSAETLPPAEELEHDTPDEAIEAAFVSPPLLGGKSLALRQVEALESIAESLRILTKAKS